jgi:putative phosphoesterase
MDKASKKDGQYVLGVLSDTHGRVRPEIVQPLENVDLILHAGDVGGPEVLETLQKLAPVAAVQGNMDYGSWAEDLPLTRQLQLGGVQIYIIHDMRGLDFEPVEAGIQVIVSGHTHQPRMEKKNGLWLLNPGSAGHRNHLNRISIAKMFIQDGRIESELIELDI